MQLEQRLPPVRAVLLPEGAVRLEAARILLGLAHHLAAVTQRARGRTVDALRVGVEADAELRPPVFGERAQSIEVGHRSPNGSDAFRGELSS